MIAIWMDRLNELGTTWLTLVLLASWRALPLLILVTSFVLALRRKLSPPLHALLWTIVIARLLLPVSLESTWSLHHPINGWFPVGATTPGDPVEPARFQVDLRAMVPSDSLADGMAAPWRAPQPYGTAPDAAEISVWYVVLLSIVLTVSAGLLLRGVLSHIGFALRLRRCRLLDAPNLINLLLHECDSLRVGRRPAVREVPSLNTPAVFGLIRPTICLPLGLLDRLSETELRWILRHELAHIRRRDIPVMVMAGMASVIHWFNPLVWLVVRKLRVAMESAADRLALQGSSQDDAASYGALLLRLAEQRLVESSTPTLGLISFASGTPLKQRVTVLIQENRTQNRLVHLVLTSLVFLLALTGLTDARVARNDKLPELHLLPDDGQDSSEELAWTASLGEQLADGPRFVATYDVGAILETIPASFLLNAQSARDRLTAWLPLPNSMQGRLQLDGKTLTADLTADQHQVLQQTLTAWQHGEPQQVTVETRFLQTDIQTASSIDWSADRTVDLQVRGRGPVIAARVGKRELTQLVEAIQSDPRGNILQAPKVTFFDGQAVLIADLVSRPFVTGVNSQANGSVQPQISMIDEGFRCELTTRIAAEDSVALTFAIKTASVDKVSYANLPIKFPQSTGKPLTVQAPATDQYEIRGKVALTAGESIVLAIPRVYNLEPGADAETTMIISLTPQIIPHQEAETNDVSPPAQR